MKKTILFFVVLFVGYLVTNTSCDNKKPANSEDTTEVVLNTQSSADATYATALYMQVISDVLVKTDQNTDDPSKFEVTCPFVSINPSGLLTYPKTLTIDYGNNCDNNGHIISGQITATISGRIRLEGTTISIAFTNFIIDSVEIDGTIALTVDTVNVLDHYICFSSDFTACELTTQSGTTTFDANFSSKWFINELTNYTDDVFDIASGTFSGTTNNAKTYDLTVLKTLVFTVDCKTIVEGEIKVETTESVYPATIDFGDGTCDHTATVSTKIEKTFAGQTIIQDFSYDITIP